MADSIQEITEAENPIEKEERELDKWFSKLKRNSIIAFGLTLLIIALFYSWKYPCWKFAYSIDAGRWGQFGDFVGGVIGSVITFCSMVFLYKAFKEQRLANVEAHGTNAKLIEQSNMMKEQDYQHLYQEILQQFDNNFNNILSLYKDAMLSYQAENMQAGKVSLSHKISTFISATKFDTNEKYTKRTSLAFDVFQRFMMNHRTMVNAHMRLLYQILILLEDANIDEDDKVIYIKTLRGQLTDEELILIRYNCMSRSGRKMQPIVFHFNLLKHIPLLDLFEFKKYRKGLKISHINLLNEELILMRKELCSLFRRISTDEQKLFSKSYGKRYILMFAVSRNNKQFQLDLTINPKSQGRVYDKMVSVFDRLDENTLENLMLDFCTEIFRHSHFRLYNRQTKFNISHKIIENEGHKRIHIGALNIEPIIISYFQIQNPTPSI